MITISSLTKNYGRFVALKELSLHVAKGEIVGVLGPNGAGKSTMMKILAGYLPPTSGSVSIDRFDLFNDSLQARARLGYLHENNPLYPEMRVEEYISYRAALKRVPSRRIAEKVVDVLDLCGLRSVKQQFIGALSKGHRQRVGLADALVNEPDLLLLDEPTLGLDPSQQRAISSLIKGLAKRHTVILSTHDLQEAAAICHRFIILHRGKMVATGTIDALRQEFTLPEGTLQELFTTITSREEH